MRHRNTAIALLVLVIAVQASAKEPAGPRNRRIAVLPVRNFAISADQVWQKGVKAPVPQEALQSFLLKRLAIEPFLDVVTPDQVTERVAAIGKNHTDRRELGLSYLKLGMSQYKALQVKNAIRHLEDAEKALFAVYEDIVDPATMATLSLTLAQCYLEEKNPDIHLRLKEMFWREPGRRFSRGFFSGSFEQAISGALHDFVATHRKKNPLITTARLERFMRDIDVAAIFFAYLENTTDGSGTQIRILVHDRHSRNVSHRSNFISTEQHADLDQIDRFVSRWITCLPPQIAGPEPPKESVSEVFLDTSFSYNLFGTLLGDKRLTSDAFHNLGMGLTVEWQFLSGLGTFAQLNMLISTTDPERDLTDSFPSLRVIGGLSYAYRGKWWRIFTRFGLEAQFLLSEFTITTHPWCKWNVQEKCNFTEQNTYQDEYMVGFHTALGAQFFMTPQIYVTTRAGFAAYILPSDRVELDLPLSFEVGLGYSL